MSEVTGIEQAQIELGKAFHKMVLAEAQAQPYIEQVKSCQVEVSEALQKLEGLRQSSEEAE